MADDREQLWEQFKRGAKPLPRAVKARKAVPKKDAAPAASGKARVKRRFVTLERPVTKAGAAPLRGTESASKPVDDPELLRRLQRGEVRFAARLDLHHLTESEAHAAVTDFLAQALARGWRALLIITGRGAVLREVVPRWLLAQPCVRFFHPAARAHGGDGALYVVLRRTGRKDRQ